MKYKPLIMKLIAKKDKNYRSILQSNVSFISIQHFKPSMP